MQAAVRNGGRHGGDVDDGPAAVADHGLSLGLARQEYAGEINVDDAPPLLFRHALGRCRVGDAGRVNPERQRPERRLDVRDSRGDGGRIGHVRGYRDRPAACGEDPGSGGLDVSRYLMEATDDGARLGEPQGYGPADPAPGASDQRDTTAQ